MVSNNFKRLLPSHSFVMKRSLSLQNRFGNSPLLSYPIVTLFRKFRNCVFGEKLWSHPLQGGFFGNGFDSVLTELSLRSTVIWIGPGATRAINSTVLIQI